jgi:hypothetical protein
MDPKPKPKQDSSIIYVGTCITSPPSSLSPSGRLSYPLSCQAIGSRAFSLFCSSWGA